MVFIEIIDSLSSIVNLINNIAVLKDRNKRKKIAKIVFSLYQVVSDMGNNAKTTESLFREILNEKHNPSNFYYRNKVEEISSVIREQYRVLLRLDETLSFLENKDIDAFCSVFNCENLTHEIDELANPKYSLINIAIPLLNFGNSDTIYVPKSLEMVMGFPPYKHYRGNDKLDYLFSKCYYYCDNPDEFLVEIPLPSLGDEDTYDYSILVNAISPLLKDIVDYGISRKIFDIKDCLGKILRENFEIEEII